MQPKRLSVNLVLVVTLLGLAACSRDDTAQPDPLAADSLDEAAALEESLAQVAGEPAMEEAETPEVHELAGTSWKLVRIASMDDSELLPAEDTAYTITFNADGRANMRVDCNRGAGTWESAEPGALTFGPLALTRAMCPPGSIHDQFVGQLGYVRSYVLRDGNLYLATMADGAIIEFEAAAEE